MSTETGDTSTDEQRREALARDKREWYIDHKFEPGITRNAFDHGRDAAIAAAGVAPPSPSEIHEPDEYRIYCVRCGWAWPCQTSPSVDRETLIAEVRDFATKQRDEIRSRFKASGAANARVLGYADACDDLIALLAAPAPVDEAKLAEVIESAGLDWHKFFDEHRSGDGEDPGPLASFTAAAVAQWLADGQPGISG